ncbi:hypothetical protein CRENBAI_017648 [Crenichthys baileyi]|uniref:Transmembrane channel-like protein n=1 Tax=Crenichthys baileyi TaxID=28760 RepID=A0AAV9RQV8_9TELE
MLPTIFAIVRYRPSQHCGPFSGQEKIYDIISDTVASEFPLWFSKVMSYVTSPVVVLPAVLLLFMLIYYLQAIARSLKFTNNQLRMQLQTERTEDKKKVFQMAAARLQAPEASADKKPDQQERDIPSQKASIHTPSPRPNGSVTNFESPVQHSNSIHTITQSASRADLKGGHVSGSVRSPAMIKLPKRQVEHLPNRSRHFMGGPSGSCRSRSCHHMTYNPPSDLSNTIHTEPLYRKTICSSQPVEAAGILAAQNYGGRHGHTTRYMIVSEHRPRKKMLCSATQIPRHYLMEGPTEILELYPCNIKQSTPRTIHHQPRPHRSHTSQQLIKEEEEENAIGRKRTALGKTHRPRSLSDHHQRAHFYIGERLESFRESQAARYEMQEDHEEDDGKEQIDWGDFNLYSPTQASIRETDPLQMQRHHVHSPGKQYQSPTRTRHMGSHLKPKLRGQFETPLTESDSTSVASSSDQQNSSTYQYIQVIHSKGNHLGSDVRQENLSKKETKTNFDLNYTGTNDFVCSNV